jgi:hypothetical protein
VIAMSASAEDLRPCVSLRHRGQGPAAERGGPQAAVPPPAPSWPRALRGDTRLAFPLDRAAALVTSMVHSAPPPQLQALMTSVAAGYGLHLYLLR